MVTIKKNGKKVWVTFTFSPQNSVKDVSVCGEWSEWKHEPMKQKKNGDYSITKVFKAGDSFEFGYKVDSNQWFIEDECPSVDSPFLTQNSVLKI